MWEISPFATIIDQIKNCINQFPLQPFTFASYGKELQWLSTACPSGLWYRTCEFVSFRVVKTLLEFVNTVSKLYLKMQ